MWCCCSSNLGRLNSSGVGMGGRQQHFGVTISNWLQFGGFHDYKPNCTLSFLAHLAPTCHATLGTKDISIFLGFLPPSHWLQMPKGWRRTWEGDEIYFGLDMKITGQTHCSEKLWGPPLLCSQSRKRAMKHPPSKNWISPSKWQFCGAKAPFVCIPSIMWAEWGFWVLWGKLI